MTVTTHLRDELAREYATTRKFFKVYPSGKTGYRPHEKSMTIDHLATHIADIFGWPSFMLETDELDLAKSDPPPTMESGNALLEAMDRGFARSKSALTSTNDQDLEKRWAMKMNGQLIYDWSKYEAIRHALNQITHHRAQLGVYYRLLEIPLPASYGPSADETFS